MERFLWICLAGAAGTGTRYLIALWAAQRFGSAFPFGTLIVNLVGCFAIAAVMHAAVTLSWSPTLARYLDASSAYRTPRYRALYRQWLDDPRNTLWMAGSPLVADAIDRGHGQVECVELSRQYLHLSPLVDVA